MSASITSVLKPASAKDKAMLAQDVDFPSPICALVKDMTGHFSLAVVNIRLVRAALIASATGKALLLKRRYSRF